MNDLYPVVMKPNEKPPEPSKELQMLINLITKKAAERHLIDVIDPIEEEREKEPKDKGHLPPRPDDNGIWVIKKGKIQQIT